MDVWRERGRGRPACPALLDLQLYYILCGNLGFVAYPRDKSKALLLQYTVYMYLLLYCCYIQLHTCYTQPHDRAKS